ncbi:hypothetical protein J2X61_003043 [Bacillus sp. 3255]|nr:hypothetical protein [Bacillus sp. 3255]
MIYKMKVIMVTANGWIKDARGPLPSVPSLPGRARDLLQENYENANIKNN